MKKLSLVAIMAVVLLGFAFPAFSAEEELFDTQEAGRHIDEGLSLLHAKKYDAAIAELQQAVEIAPEAEAYYYLGYAYYLKGRSGDSESREKSRDYFEQAYEIDPNFTPTRIKPTEPAMEPPARMSSEPAGTAEQPKP